MCEHVLSPNTAGCSRPRVSGNQPARRFTFPPSLFSLSFLHPPLPPTSLIMRGRKLTDTLSSPNSHCTMAVERERGGEKKPKKKTESGAKCERGLVSMPTAGGRTHAASQPARVPARHLFLSLLFSLLACPPLLSPLSVGEIRLGPVPGIKPYLSSWG